MILIDGNFFFYNIKRTKQGGITLTIIFVTTTIIIYFISMWSQVTTIQSTYFFF